MMFLPSLPAHDKHVEQLLLHYARQVEAVEADLKPLPQVEIPVRHYFSHGVYAREITIPADTVVIGKIHKYENLNILSKGEKSVLTESGVVRVQAPFTIVSPPGTKRIGYTHTECVWTTIHGTFERDLEKIEDLFVVGSVAEFQLFCEQRERLCLG